MAYTNAIHGINIKTGVLMIKRFTFLYFLIFLSAVLTYSQQIIPNGAKLEKVFGEGFFTEGPAEAPDGSIYFSDQTFTSESDMQAGYIWKYNPKTGKTIIFRSPSGMANGNKFDVQGRMITATGADFGLRSVIRTDMTSGKSQIIAGLYNDKPFNSPNDIAIDKQGRVYFTDPKYGGYELKEQPVMGVYRIDTDGKVSLIISDISMPNGIAVSPDQKSLFVGCFDEGDSARKGNMAILVYDLDEKGESAFRKVFVDFSPNDGPDGIAFDDKGNLFAAIRNESRPGISVFNSEGKEIEYIPTPEVPSNLAFTRHDKINFIYITAGRSLYRINTLSKGYFSSSK
jgi:gluconolactonase